MKKIAGDLTMRFTLHLRVASLQVDVEIITCCTAKKVSLNADLRLCRYGQS